MISVYYDDKCSLCSREINFYKKIAPKNTINWLGISSSLEDLKYAKLTEVDVLKYLHVRDSNGNFYVGVDAFIIIWSKLPYFIYLKYIISLPVIYQIATFIYDKFANYRFKKLGHCQLALKKKK
ncbi:DUF393 domain-containing protein [Methylophilaceae bacterium]|jgi:predicted DCC family thiol-disulfide oxidoreductase YuxK|nr:DUF393 domain-containing protein [Methylophilaceae bacterium]|tara:strand:+ start:985 stop:1356 length:372 start_codon:yes stop_codon:yes gene_type:complete